MKQKTVGYKVKVDDNTYPRSCYKCAIKFYAKAIKIKLGKHIRLYKDENLLKEYRENEK